MSNSCTRFHSGKRIRIIGTLIAIAGLAGCAGGQPQPYSPNYHYITVADGGGGGVYEKGPRRDGIVRKGYDTTNGMRRVLVPDACVTPDTGEYPLYLPRGCANNLNLQQMVANENDLLQGREMGPAMAEPTARAARNYIDGNKPADNKPRQRFDDNILSSGQ